MKAQRKILSVTVSILMILALLTIYIPSRVSAVGGIPKTFDGSVTYYDGEKILLKPGSKTEGTVTIADKATVDLEISDLTINNTIDEPCIKVGNGSTLKLTLTGSNNLTITKALANSASIDTSGGTIYIYGNGSLTANGAFAGAGIGGGDGESGGNINISGGSITATVSSGFGAGIGGGNNGSGGNINISGGIITAKSNFGAGIGGGYQGSGGNINISGGSITATGGNLNGAADIGLGASATLAPGDKTIITGGSVNPTNNNVDPSPTVSDGITTVTMSTVGVGSNNLAVKGLYFNQKTFQYGFQDVVSDTNKNIYIWLPNGVGVNKIKDLYPNNGISDAIAREISNETALTYSASDTLTKTMAESVKQLDFSNLGLDNISPDTNTSFDNLKNLINLETLDISTNKLRTLPTLVGLNNLNSINAANNQITSLPDLTVAPNLNLLNSNFNNQTYSEDLAQINSGSNEVIELPILSELGMFPGFKGFTYKLTGADGVGRDITGDIKVNSNGLIIPGKDLISSGRYRIEVKGDSSQNPNVGNGTNYSGDYIYTFTVVGGPVPTTGVIVADTNKLPTTGVIVADTNKLPNTGEMVIMYVGLGLIIGGLGIYLTSKKMKAKKK